MEYGPEVRAGVLASVASGQSINSVAKQFGVSRRTVQTWRDQSPFPIVQQEKKQALGELVYGLTEDYLKGLRVQIRVTSEEDWIRRQSADSLAILHGVYADKLIRILAAIQPDTSIGDAGR